MFRNSIPESSVAGTPYARRISSLHRPQDDEVHPMVLDAIVDFVLALPPDSNSPMQPQVAHGPLHKNPYFGLIQLSPRPQRIEPSLTYESFWAGIQGKVLSSSNNSPTSNFPPSHAPSSPSSSENGKRSLDMFSDLKSVYPSLAPSMNVTKVRDVVYFNCSCRAKILNEPGAIMHHLQTDHMVTDLDGLLPCPRRDCRKKIKALDMATHIEVHHPTYRFMCGLCNHTMSRHSSAVTHISSQACPAFKTTGLTSGTGSPRKRVKN